MRGPQGPVRGGVTRCGRPPPLCRGRGRGKTSRLPTPPFSPAIGDRQLNMFSDDSVLRGSTLSHRIERGSIFFTGNEMFFRCVVRFLRNWRIIVKQTRFPVNVYAGNGEGGREENATKGAMTRDVNEKGDDKVRRISRVKGLFERSRPTTALPRASSCWRFSALSAAWQVPRRWSALKSTAQERSRRDTVCCAASRPDRRRPLRLIMACRTRRRRLGRCATCRRSPRHPGAASNSPTPCRRPARSGRRHRTRACRGRGRPTSRGWYPYWLTKAKTACI